MKMFFFQTLYNAVLISEICENAGTSSELLEEIATYDNSKLYEVNIQTISGIFSLFLITFQKILNFYLSDGVVYESYHRF